MPDRERRRRTAAATAAEGAKESPVEDLEDICADVRERFYTLLELPDDFKLHLRGARREMLLAVRSLIDARLAALEERERRRAASQRGHVVIE